MTADPPRARLPERAPSKADLEERDRYAKLAVGSADSVRASAQAWRNGLTAFITFVTTGVVITGRDSTSDLPLSWRVAVIVLVGGGLLLAVLGLWQALAAEAGTRPQKQTLQDIRAAYGTLTTYQVHLADIAAGRLRWGIRAATAAIALLITGIAVTWVAPGSDSWPEPAAYVTVVHGNAVTCGALQSAAGGQLRLAVASGTITAVVPFAQISGLTLTASCPLEADVDVRGPEQGTGGTGSPQRFDRVMEGQGRAGRVRATRLG